MSGREGLSALDERHVVLSHQSWLNNRYRRGGHSRGRIQPSVALRPGRGTPDADRTRAGFLRRYGWRLDRAVIKLTNGHVSMSLILPEVLLTHAGAKTGKQRSTPLTYRGLLTSDLWSLNRATRGQNSTNRNRVASAA